jgi:hypothetical protein
MFSRVVRSGKRALLVALASLVVASAVLPPVASAETPTVAQVLRAGDGSGDNPVVP